jgi:EcsC protein family
MEKSPPLIEAWEPTPEELRDLRLAKTLLEKPGLTARLANLLGSPIEKGFELLPPNWADAVQKATRGALVRALELAVLSIPARKQQRASETFHKFLVGVSGAVGGVFGLPAMTVELPISTTIMLRSIVDIARSEGHNVDSAEVKLSCLEVFAFGGRTHSDDAAESGYWAIRAALAKSISEAAGVLTQRSALSKTAPAVMRLVSAIASRFGVVVSEQLAAKAVPVVGAAGGSLINVLFMNHFQDMARGHFIVKRLEQAYGRDAVKFVYDSLAMPI